ncbi:MAG: cytochrome c-type biogenesis CcmF C-terminal domain-containing protein [Dehalococcoidia bacterium]
MAIAVVATNVYQEQVRAVVAPGEAFEAGGYTFQFENFAVREPGVDGIDEEIIAQVTVLRDGQHVSDLEPGRRFFANFPEMPIGLVAVDGNLQRDLYLFLQGYDPETGQSEFHVFVNPLQQWLWIGAGIYVAGGVLAFGLFRAPRPVEVDARAAAGDGAQRA